MTTGSWREGYEQLAASLADLAARARPVLCGLGVCVDVYARLERLAPALRAARAAPADRLRARLLERAAQGVGGEIRIDWADGPAWLDHEAPGTPGLGGTGAQAAQTLAVLGAPALLALNDRSAAQLALVHPTIRVGGPEGPQPAGDVTPKGVARAPHLIVEFSAGVAADGVVPPRSSRVIVRFDDDPLPADPWFIDASVECAASAGAGIVSGLNALPPGTLRDALDWIEPMVGRWRERGLDLVHLEVGDYARSEDASAVLDSLGGAVSSLGLSHAELEKSMPGAAPVARRARRLAERLCLERVVVHADEWALSVTAGNPERELEALMTGSLVAATRASLGHIARPSGCPPGARFGTLPEPSIAPHGEFHVVCCATPYLSRPTATIGLGDTFLAGMLLRLG